MKKYNIQDMNMQFLKDDYSFEVDVYDNVVKITRAKFFENVNIYDFIHLKRSIVEVKRIIKFNGKERDAVLSNRDKDEIVNSIFNVLENDNITKDLLFVDTIKSLVKASYTNIIITNEELGLSSTNTNIRTDNIINLDIVHLERNEIIGTIKVINNNIAINVGSEYYSDIRALLNQFMCLFRGSGKKLINNF